MNNQSNIIPPYLEWEDFKNGMYAKTSNLDENLINSCVDLLSNEDGLLEAMDHVIYSWVVSANAQMTNASRNRQAWLGQAACCLYYGATDHITKIAWNRLTEKVRERANAVADIVINKWDAKEAQDNQYRLFSDNG